jgi:hypothetical protein
VKTNQKAGLTNAFVSEKNNFESRRITESEASHRSDGGVGVLAHSKSGFLGLCSFHPSIRGNFEGGMYFE